MDYKDFFMDHWQEEAPARAKSSDESLKTAATIELIQRPVRTLKSHGSVSRSSRPPFPAPRWEEEPPFRRSIIVANSLHIGARWARRFMQSTAPAPTSPCSVGRGILR